MTVSALAGREGSYDTVDGKWVTYRAGGKPGRRFIRHPGDDGWVETFERIPIVDFTDIGSEDVNVRRRLANELAEAAEHCGFWYAANTPVSPELAQKTFATMEEYFALPEAVKRQCDWSKTPGCRGYESFAEVAENEGSGNAQATLRESFMMGDDPTDPVQWSGDVPAGFVAQNIWPTDMPWFKKAFDDYYSVVMPFARAVLRLFALALGIEETALDHLHQFPITALRAIHYPPQEPDESAPGLLPHADYSPFTFVLQNPKYGSGLEVLNLNGHWIPAPPLPGTTFTCNIGDYLQHLSGGRFVSTVHRVVNRSGEERFSMPFFFSPDPGAVLHPVTLRGAQRKAEIVPFEGSSIGHHFVKRLLHARRQHPTSKRVRDLGLPEEQWR